MRLWTGGTGEATAPTHTFTPGVDIPLGQTGLQVRFSDFGLPGDCWIIAARPHTPQVVVPWELLEAAPAFGPRFFFAPLALIRWAVDAAGAVQGRVHDCRTLLRPLCSSNGCCTVTVGDGVSSHGDFDAIEEAIEYLPSSGGEICLLPGLHEANVRIVGKHNITVKGCDKQTRVMPRPAQRQGPIFQVRDSQGITLTHMDLVTSICITT